MLTNILISLTQGITELLPISSSGHLLIVTTLLGNPADQTSLIFLHFWTALAIIIAYFSKIIELFKTKQGLTTLLYIGIATIPAAVTGFLLDEWFEANFYSLWVIAINFIFWGIVMIIVEKKFDKRDASQTLEKQQTFSKTTSETEISTSTQNSNINLTSDKQSEISIKQLLIMGFAQILALIPGTSRSGVTTMAGMVSGLKKSISLDYAFLLGIPVTFGPFVIKILKDSSVMSKFATPEYLAQGVATFIFGVLAIKILQSIKNRNFLTGFGVYRIIVGVALVIYLSR